MNKQTCLEKPWQPGYPVHEYIDGKIEDHDHAQPNDTVIYSIIDTHYYLHGWEPANQKEGDYYHAVGGNFFPVPGRYLLPFNEGQYTVGGDA